MSEYHISVAKDFSTTPGGRYVRDGKWSGEEFRKNVVEEKLRDVIKTRGKLWVSLDGVAGYATSFLEEAFGGLVRDLRLRISPFLIIETTNSVRQVEVGRYIQDEESRLA